MYKIALIAACLTTTFSAQAQLSKAFDKAKDKVKNNDSQTAPANNGTNNSKSESAPISTTPKTERDEKGYIINDPEAAKRFIGHEQQFTTDRNLFATLLNFFNDFKMVGSYMDQSGDKLELTVVAQKKYQGIVSNTVTYQKMGEYFKDDKNNTYLTPLPDGSWLLFQPKPSQNAFELIAKDATKIYQIDETGLQATTDAKVAELKKAKAKADQMKLRAQNETFFKSGDIKASTSNPVLEKQFMTILTKENGYPTVPVNEKAAYKKIYLISTDWSLIRNDLDQPKKMTYSAWTIGNYTADGACFFQKVWFKKDYLGGGKYSEVKFDEGEKPSIISCELIK